MIRTVWNRIVLSRVGNLKAAACAGLVVAASSAFAVPPGTASWSADTVCMMRAIASQQPDRKLRNPDNLAARICPRPFELRDYESARTEIDAAPERYAGYFYTNARTHYIDAALVRAAKGGASQVVILGAGLDNRAYRLHADYPMLRFFEVDLPEMIATKKERLQQGSVPIPDQVKFVSIDFEAQSLEDVLPAAGYDPAQKTLFILEGVSMYISETGTGSTLEFVRHQSAPGSAIVFDYVLRGVVSGDRSKFYGMAYAAGMLAEHGEPFVNGWTPMEVAAFVQSHGLKLIEDVGTDVLAERYLVGSDGKMDGKVLEGNRILEAKVP